MESNSVVPEIPFKQTICKCVSEDEKKKESQCIQFNAKNTLQTHTRNTRREPGVCPSIHWLDRSPVTPHRCLCLTTDRAPQPGQVSVVQSHHVKPLCWVLSYTSSMWRGSCNTCGGKWPSGFSGPRAHGWQFTRIPCADCTGDCVTIPNREKHGSTESDFKHGSTQDFDNAFHFPGAASCSPLLIMDKGAGPR